MNFMAVCARKKHYETKREAKNELAKLAKRFGGSDAHVYRCAACGKWCLGRRR